MQSVPITNKVVSSNPIHGEVNQIHYVISLWVPCDRSMVFSGYYGFLHQWNWPPRYNWNIVESGTKHHEHKPNLLDLWQRKMALIINALSTHFTSNFLVICWIFMTRPFCSNSFICCDDVICCRCAFSRCCIHGNANFCNFSAISWREPVNFQWMMMRSALF